MNPSSEEMKKESEIPMGRLKEESRTLIQTSMGQTLQRIMQIMPHGTDVKNAAYIGDISMKGYISFHQLLEMLYWSSAIECAITILFVLLFIQSPMKMLIIPLHFPHIIRAFFGYFLVKMIPKTHDVLQSYEVEAAPIDFDVETRQFARHASNIYLGFLDSHQSKIVAYFGLTVICLLLDGSVFIYQIFVENDQVGMLIILRVLFALILLFLDIYYLLYGGLLSIIFPKEISDKLLKPIKGSIGILKTKLMDVSENMQRGIHQMQNSSAYQPPPSHSNVV